MKDIKQLSLHIQKFTDKIVKNVVKAQRDTAEEIWADVVAKAPIDTGAYVSSIRIAPTVKEENRISTKIYTDATVSTMAGVTYNLGFLLENGTDPHAIPNAFGLGYTTGHIGADGKFHKGTLDKDWHPGSIERPHFIPALEQNKIRYVENIARAVKEAEK